MTVRRILAGAVALATSLVIGVLAFLLSPVAPAISGVVFALCALPVGIGLGWVVFVAPATTADITEDDVESRWLNSALSGTATDLVVVIGLSLTAVSITRVDLSPTLLLTSLLVVAFGSCTLRYALQRYRTLSA